jgi:A/G-specific adenine glycosylase
MLPQPADRTADSPQLTGRRIGALRRRLLDWYAHDGRRDLPWRLRRDPYRTLVSEFMLQQTQAERVAGRFQTFLSAFPNMGALAAAPTSSVLRAWKGLGYNSRAVRLKAVAAEVVRRYGGAMPRETQQLLALPGVGPYTAAAVRAFAFDLDDAPLDTNVRRVVSRACFGGAKTTPKALAQQARRLVAPGRGHDWSSALMDLGALVCTPRAPRCSECPIRTLCEAAARGAVFERPARGGAVPATPFQRTTRYARGRIVDRLRDLRDGERIALLDLHRDLEPLLRPRTFEEVRALVAGLERDGLVSSDVAGTLSLPS